MKRGIVLDKNFLQGASAFEVRALASSHRLLMSAALFYELLTTDAEARRKCFVKLPPIENPVLLVDHIGVLLAHEVRTGRPSGQPSGHRFDLRFRFNEALLSNDYVLPAEAQEAIASQRSDAEEDVQRLLDLSDTTPSLFPGLLSGTADEQAQAHRQAEALVGRLDAVLGFYRSLPTVAPTRLHPKITGKLGKWAHLRWLQVLMLFAMDLHVRYRGNIRQALTPKVLVRLEHDVHDAQVLSLGVLEGGIATRERKLLRWWGLLRPDVLPVTRTA